MGVTIKRTYKLSRETVERVRELAERSGIARTQDGIVDAAVERLYLEVRAEQEADLWATAREDQEFRAEMSAIARDF
jgi:predicted transcriptional regulator